MFFDFVELQRANGEQIAQAILASLSANNIDIKECRGQAYDGASATSSQKVGVQSRVKEVSPLALYTHCNSHILNLSIASACQIPLIRNMINETFLFFDNSPKRQRFFETILQALGSESIKVKLQGLCKTRWIERHTCYETFYDLCYFVCCCCEAIVYPEVYIENNVSADWDWDANTKVKAQGLLHSLKSGQQIVSFVVAKNSLELVKPLATKLQKKDQNILQAYNMIVKEQRKNINSEFHEWYADAERISNDVGSEISVPRIAGRQTNRANSVIQGGATEDYYRMNIAVPFIDHLLQELLTRCRRIELARTYLL